MQSAQVRIKLERDAEKIKVATIRLLSCDVTYVFPPGKQNIERHGSLYKIPVVKQACKSLINTGQYRNITVTLKDDIMPLYFDEEMNCVFEEIYLEERIEYQESESLVAPNNSMDNQTSLLRLIEKLTARLDAKEHKSLNLSQVHKQFVIEKFQGTENARDWMDLYEKECGRHEILTDEDKIRVLRLFLEKNASEWYASTLCKLTLEGQWLNWRENFLKTYSDKSWRSVQFAYSFRFITGSILDYALKKERLLLQTESDMSNISRINHIVVGLPFFVQDRLDKDQIETTEQLMNQLRKFNHISKIMRNNPSGSKPNTEPGKSDDRNQKSKEKKACTICESRGFLGRYHKVEYCRFRERNMDHQSVNLTENADISENSNEEQQKN